MAKFQFVLVLLVAAASAASFGVGKIAAPLQKSLATKTRVNVLVNMRQGTESALSAVTSHSTYAKQSHGQKATAVYKALTAHASASQASVLALLNSPRAFTVAKFQSLWITNQVYVQGADASIIESLASLEDVESIAEERVYQLEEPVVADDVGAGINAEWGITIMRAEDAWAFGTNGTGAIVGVIDTGVRHTHEAIRDGYRGGTHSWYDPYTQTMTPNDGHGHGTHVTGTVAGSFGIGVAPGAKWISCKGFTDTGSATEAALVQCGQFMACPHTYNGGSPNCNLAPNAVSNSWTAQGQDGVLRTYQAANIIPVFAHGNYGPGCYSSAYPGDSDLTIGVAASTQSDGIASFSSRGPAPNGAQKPDITAPGNAIRSAGHTSDSSYVNMSGTSMACPHAAGLVGLLKGKNPAYTFEQIRDILRNTSDRNLQFTGENCNGRPDSQFPNYTFGYGRINALRAVQA